MTPGTLSRPCWALVRGALSGSSYDWAALSSKINSMQPNGNTNQAIVGSAPHDRYGSIASVPPCQTKVRFTLDSDRIADISGRQLR
jgi:hypothetical protein